MFRIGIDLGGTKTEALALDPAGNELARQRIATPKNYAGALEALASLVAQLEAKTGTAHVGLGHPGSISPRDRRIRNANSTWLNGQALHADLEARLGRPVRMANDADCFALSEARDGAGAKAGTVFGIITGTGVGGGIVVDGRLLHGAQGIAGEWGHNALPRPRADESPGPACWCGRQGCIETWLSGPGFAADHARREGGSATAEAICAAAAAGDRAALESLDLYADRFARALADVVNILDPHVVVLGGGLSNAPDLPERIEARLSEHVFSDVIHTRIRRNVHGDSSGVRGAAWLWPLEAA